MFYPPRIAIVGGGLTGATAAIELLRTNGQSFDLTIIEPEELLGRGLAYGKAESFHLLNVRAGKLGVLNGQPGDFAAWARERRFGIRPRPDQPEPNRAFLPRRLFGAYVDARLQEEVASRPDVSFTHARARASGVRRCPAGYEIALNNQPPIIAQYVIFATGYGRAPQIGRFGRSPFTDLDTEEVRAARMVLFVGTGLTFVDEFLRLKSRGFRGDALAISRHALLPEVHRANEMPWSFEPVDDEPKLVAMLSVFRRAMEEREPPASAAVDLVLGLRPQIQSLWQSLGPRRQRQFLHHLRPYWNAARHRLAPEIHAQLRQSMQTGVLKVAAGCVSARGENEVRLHLRGAKPIDRRFDFVFDCTGFRPEVRGPLALSLIRQGLARIDPHQLGLSVAPDGALLAKHGVRSPGLFALGPLGHGSLYEITAVPEIVAQSAAMAKSLRKEMRRVRSIERAGREDGGARPRAG